jgi:ParB family chromosome partitioning protein
VQGDHCLDSSCYHSKVEAFLDREIAAHPGLVQIEYGWRNPKEQRPGAVQRGHIRELPTVTDNPDAEPVMPCAAAKSAIIVYGKNIGRKLTVCTDKHCPVHDPQAAAEAAAHPIPKKAPAPEIETEEEAAQRAAEHEPRMAEYKAEQKRKEEERKAEFERQQKEYEAEQARRDKQRKARVATFERIIEQAPASFSPAQMRVFLRLLIQLDYSFLEEVASYFANGDENGQQSDDEIVLAALDGTADEKLTSFALRLVLSDHIGIPHEIQPDLLAEAEQVFAPKKPKVVKAKGDGSSKPKPIAVKASAKKETTKKKAA